MLRNDAIRFAEFLKNGKTHKSGHYHYGYIFLSYNSDKQMFEIKREDLSINIYEPSVSYEFVDFEQIVEFLEKFYKLTDFDSLV